MSSYEAAPEIKVSHLNRGNIVFVSNTKTYYIKCNCKQAIL